MAYWSEAGKKWFEDYRTGREFELVSDIYTSDLLTMKEPDYADYASDPIWDKPAQFPLSLTDGKRLAHLAPWEENERPPC